MSWWDLHWTWSNYIQKNVDLKVGGNRNQNAIVNINLLQFCIKFQEKALSVFRLAYDKAVALGYKLDIIFYQIRIGLFYLDNDLITRNIDKAKT